MNRLSGSASFLVFSFAAMAASVAAEGGPSASPSATTQLGAPKLAARPAPSPAGRPGGQAPETNTSERFRKAVASDPQMTKLKSDLDKLVRGQGSGSRLQALTELAGQLDARGKTLAREMNFDLSAQPIAAGQVPVFAKPSINASAALINAGALTKTPAASPLVFEFDSFPGRGSSKLSCPQGSTSSSANKLMVNGVAWVLTDSESRCDTAAEWRYATMKLPKAYHTYSAKVYLHIKRADLLVSSHILGSDWGGASWLWAGLGSNLGGSSNPKETCALEQLSSHPPEEKALEDLTVVCEFEISGDAGGNVQIGPMARAKTLAYTENYVSSISIGYAELHFDHMRVEFEDK